MGIRQLLDQQSLGGMPETPPFEVGQRVFQRPTGGLRLSFLRSQAYFDGLKEKQSVGINSGGTYSDDKAEYRLSSTSISFGTSRPVARYSFIQIWSAQQGHLTVNCKPTCHLGQIYHQLHRFIHSLTAPTRKLMVNIQLSSIPP
jgi:hypothetical protein